MTWRCLSLQSSTTSKMRWWLELWANCSSISCAFLSDLIQSSLTAWKVYRFNRIQPRHKRRQANLRLRSQLRLSEIVVEQLRFFEGGRETVLKAPGSHMIAPLSSCNTEMTKTVLRHCKVPRQFISHKYTTVSELLPRPPIPAGLTQCGATQICISESFQSASHRERESLHPPTKCALLQIGVRLVSASFVVS